ncbi:MAG TPA: GreA/GreB family elongation factor [Desulfobacterales bacterium]|nr:GreA/GreB family elongation factor [Desulfobacterales bacterium]
MHDRIHVTSWDRRRLRSLLHAQHDAARFDRRSLDRLRQALESAVVVHPPFIPSTTITMHSSFSLLDLDTRQRRRCTLVFPGEATRVEGALSIFAPLGVALLGRREGEVVECPAPGGTTRIRVEAIVFQPEAVGDYLR